MPETLGEVSIILNTIKDDIKEMKQDGKETKEQTYKTNGRVNKHDDEFVHIHQSLRILSDSHKKFEDELSKVKEETKRLRSTLIDWLLRILMAIFGAGTAAQKIGELIKHLMS